MPVTETFDLESYLSRGVEDVVRDLVRTSLFHPVESKFMAQYALASKRAEKIRHRYEQRGEHIPSYLICSITSICNLHCAGCYARSLDTCEDGEPVQQLSALEWSSLFSQARELGIGFILLAGGEPMVRRDVIREAANYPEILFPIFTNGTLISEEYFSLLDKHRNLIPVFSIEGGEGKTDQRRGGGVFKKVQDTMLRMKEHHIVFGASITVTRENLDEVTSEAFLDRLYEQGCKGVIYVEFVPTNHDLQTLALDDETRARLAERLSELRQEEKRSMLLISFPGDEKSSGGCLAAGRGFFHINSHGGAEPCPFSPYSDLNVRDTGLREALHSPLFTALRSGDILLEEHDGGCVLFQKREQVEALLGQEG